MLKKRPFEISQALLYDPVAANRNATRASLFSLGFAKVELASSVAALEDYLRDHRPDLVFLEIAGAEAEICRIVQAVRQGLLGANPFVVIIVTTWRRDGTLVGQIVNSGADDVLARPLSTGTLGERIKAQIERRKDFVVTSDYIGPDRRRLPGRAATEGFQVPNALKLKAEDGVSETDAQLLLGDAVEEGKVLLNSEKLRRDGASLATQWRFLEQRQPDARDYRDILGRMDSLALDIKRRVSSETALLDESEQRKAAQWGSVVRDGVKRIEALLEKGAAPVPEIAGILENLGHAALTLARLLAPEESSSGLVELDTVPRRESQRAVA